MPGVRLRARRPLKPAGGINSSSGSPAPHPSKLIPSSVRRRLLAACAFTATLFLWGTLISQFPAIASAQSVAELDGRVRTDQGQALSAGVTVTLTTFEGNVAAQVPVDATGAFHIQGLARINYDMSVTAPGFETYDRRIDLRYTVTEEYVDVVMNPISTEVRRPAPAVTDLKAPKAARREFAKGRRALRSKKARQARDDFEAAVKDYPCYARAQTDLGLTLSALHHYKAAESALRKAIHCDPGFLDSYPMLGQLLNAEKRYAESETVLRSGLRQAPGSWQFYYQLGVADYGLGKYHRAVGEFRKAEQMTPPPPADIHVKLANSYVKLESFDEAYDQMADYLHTAPEGPFAPRLRQIMQQMRAAGVIHPPSAPSHQSQVHPR